MKTKTHYFGFFFGLLLWGIAPKAMAQSGLSSSVNSVELNVVHHSYIIGEMTLVHSARSSQLTVTQGTLQPTEQTLGVEDVTDWVKDIKIYPNPVRETLYIDTYVNIGSEFSYRLVDLNGRLLYSSKKKINNDKQQHSLDMGMYQTGTYILDAEIMHEGKKATQRFKVVKH